MKGLMGRVRRLSATLVLVFLLVASGGGKRFQAAQPGDRYFSPSFEALRQVVGREHVGECLQNEQAAENGNLRQSTVKGKGELVSRQSDRRSAFTNGYESWVSSPDGVAKRLNSARFRWELDAVALVPASTPT